MMMVLKYYLVCERIVSTHSYYEGAERFIVKKKEEENKEEEEGKKKHRM